MLLRKFFRGASLHLPWSASNQIETIALAEHVHPDVINGQGFDQSHTLFIESSYGVSTPKQPTTVVIPAAMISLTLISGV